MAWSSYAAERVSPTRRRSAPSESRAPPGRSGVLVPPDRPGVLVSPGGRGVLVPSDLLVPREPLAVPDPLGRRVPWGLRGQPAFRALVGQRDRPGLLGLLARSAPPSCAPTR